jgi:hypothetical protein
LDAAKARGLTIDEPTASMQQVTAIASDSTIAGSHIASHRSSRRPVIVVTIIALTILVLGLGMGLYYFVIRLQDSDYVQVSSYVDILLNDVKTTSQVATELHNIGDEIGDADLKRATDLGLQTQSYTVNLTQLKSSTPLLQDSVISTDYSRDAAKIDNYGKAVNDSAASIAVYETAMVKLNKFSDEFKTGHIKTLEAFDAATKDVIQYLQAHTSVSVKDFNDIIYTKSRDIGLSTIVDLRTYILLYASGNTKQSNAAQQKVSKDIIDAKAIALTAKAYTFTLPTDPSAALKDLQIKVNDRKTVFWR